MIEYSYYWSRDRNLFTLNFLSLLTKTNHKFSSKYIIVLLDVCEIHVNKWSFIIFSCWHEELDEFFRSYEENHGAKLDFLIMNSVLWDTNRWGPFYVENYKEKFGKLIALVKETLSENGQFIWLTNQPGSKFLNSKAMEIPGLVFQKITTRYNVIEANFFAAHRIAEAGYSVIDLHYYFLLQTFRRNR